MTLKELASQLNRPVGDVIKALTLKGFKGIHNKDHIVPSEAIQVVIEVLENDQPTQVALPSANTAPITESVPEAPKTNTSEGIAQLKDRVENTFQAVSEARQHIGTQGFQQEVDNKALAGVVAALAGQAAYNEAYLNTVGVLYGRDINEQQKAITSILDTITNPDFFGQVTPAESYFKVSQIKASNTLLRQATASAEALK
jgi:hypothetical protein